MWANMHAISLNTRHRCNDRVNIYFHNNYFIGYTMHVCSLLLRQLAVILLAAVTIVVQTAPDNAQGRDLAGMELHG